MTQRTAHMDLEWEKEDTGDYYAAALPAIPGYPGTQTDNSVLIVVHPVEDGYGFGITVANVYYLPGVGDVPIDLYNDDFGIPDTDTADEMMAAVDNLTVADIADALQAKGYAPDDDASASRKGKHMIRKAMKRTARLDLDWEHPDPEAWTAPLPYIPGYPCADGFSNSVEVVGQSDLEGTDWSFVMYLELQKESVNLYNEDFGIYDTVTAEQLMNEVENLTVADIADALAAKGYMPDED